MRSVTIGIPVIGGIALCNKIISAISIANIERNQRIFSGRILLSIIQNPRIPTPNRAATDSAMIMSMSILPISGRYYFINFIY